MAQLGVAVFWWVAAKVRWFSDLIYGGIPAKFESAYDIEESVKRLSAVTREFPVLDRGQVAQGEVSKHFVSIHRPGTLFAIDFRLGPFEPHFKGEFSCTNGQVSLSGWFTLGTLMKTFWTVWFGFAAIWTVIALRPFLAGDLQFWWFPLAGIGSFALGAAYVRLGKQCWRSDILWLSNLIRHALSGQRFSAGSR